jgi:hypothetical protein
MEKPLGRWLKGRTRELNSLLFGGRRTLARELRAACVKVGTQVSGGIFGPLLSLAGLCLGTASATGQWSFERRGRNRQTLGRERAGPPAYGLGIAARDSSRLGWRGAFVAPCRLLRAGPCC